MDGEASDQSDEFGGEITHEHPSYGPVYHVDATDIPRTYGQVVSLIMTCSIQAWQIIGVVTEVGIHLEDIAIVSLYRPFETCDIGGAKPQFTRTLNDKKAAGEFGIHQSVYDLCGAVGASVVDDQDMETLLKRKHSPYDFLYVFLLVICRNDYYTIRLFHCFMS